MIQSLLAFSLANMVYSWIPVLHLYVNPTYMIMRAHTDDINVYCNKTGRDLQAKVTLVFTFLWVGNDHDRA